MVTDAELTGADLTGAEFARRFFTAVVEPLLSQAVPGLPYAAGRLGSGSDVLGLDDATSRDHDWGCRLSLLVDEEARNQVPRLRRLLEENLPERFLGYPVRFPVTWDSSVTHKVDVSTVGDFAEGRLGVNPVGGLSVAEWLSLTGQSVLEVTAGPVFTDRTAALAPARSLLAWYPSDVERYVLAAAWHRFGQALPMVGRTADAGDELGSRLLSARLAGDLLWLAFAVCRRWAPYAKWRGTMFRSLPVAAAVGPLLDAAATAPAWRQREDALAAVCEELASRQRDQGLPAPRPAVTSFYDRPYRTVDLAMTRSLLDGISDPEVARLPMLGSVEQWLDRPDAPNPGRLAVVQAAMQAAMRAAPQPPFPAGMAPLPAGPPTAVRPAPEAARPMDSQAAAGGAEDR
jgi:hypothetical protein